MGCLGVGSVKINLGIKRACIELNALSVIHLICNKGHLHCEHQNTILQIGGMVQYMELRFSHIH